MTIAGLARVAVVAYLALTAACSPTGPSVDDDTIVLVTANACASPRAAERLEDALAVSDVCGAVSVTWTTAPRATPDDVAATVAQLDGTPRAVIAVLGDRTLLRGIDPADPVEAARSGLTSRHVDVDAWLAETRALRASGVLVATAPLGRAARVEIPELVEAADALRDAGLVDIDLGATFADTGDRVLTERGYDVLDAFGEQLVVRALFAALVADALPARDEAEQAARREARALDAWLHRRDDWRDALAAALDDVAPPPTLRHAARRAALDLARDGWRAGAALTDLDVPRDDPDAPGLAIALMFDGRPPVDWTPSDPVEAALLAALRDLPTARERLVALTAEHPHRLDAWIGRQLVALADPRPSRLRGRAMRALDAHAHAAPPLDAAIELATPWPGGAAAVLPALVAAQRPFADEIPSGPWLDDARRRARLGFTDPAVRRLRVALERHRDLHPIARETLTELEGR